MSDTTPRVALPLLAAAQSQKHVTHNEALLGLDALIATTILDRDLSAPPASPDDGDTYLVKAAGTGAWTGQSGKLAYAIDGGWRFYAPFEGLSAYVADETKLIFYNGLAWADFVSAVPLQNVPMLGINATADATNKLSVASSAVLFNHIGASVQAKLNKHAAGDTASLLYQTNFSGRAEIGLTGDDNFHFKVSPDGTTFYEAVVLNRNTGSVLLKHTDISGTATLGATHLGRVVRADASGGAFNITLPAGADADDWVIVRKKDSSANRVTVKTSGGTDMAWLSSQYDEAMFAFWDGAWTPVRWNIAPLAQVFTANGTYTKPPLAQSIEATVIGAGAGGGSGRRGAAGSARSGGQGGQSGVLNRWSFAASAISASESITIGAAGSGGAAQSADSTDGNAGGAGGTSSFGAHLIALGGQAGVGGGAAASATLSQQVALAGATAVAVTATSVTATAAASNDGAGPGNGGNGGGMSTANTAFAGTAGSNGSTPSNSRTNGGAAGTTGSNGGNGGSISDTVHQWGGAGGGGGGGNSAAAGGAGGSGGTPGGGGAGGGASSNGNNSGAGGGGARGEVRLVSYF
ncbi:MAG: DUF2793 domain-containing protein [Alphaproteobacteria bacterium]|nr:DUF2793 domain-containing protein [Alphaproteobacteria bacterium]